MSIWSILEILKRIFRPASDDPFKYNPHLIDQEKADELKGSNWTGTIINWIVSKFDPEFLGNFAPLGFNN